MGRNLVGRIAGFRLRQFGGPSRPRQFANLGLQQVDLLLLAKYRAIQRVEVVLRQPESDFQFADN